MRRFPGWWTLAGGWAVEAWVGGVTRQHADVDIAVFAADQRALFEHLAGWHLVAHDPNVDGETSDLWNGRRLDLPGHVHARPSGAAVPGSLSSPAQQGFALDIQLDEREGDDLVLNRDPRVALPLAEAVAISPWKVPTLRPVVLLFYKALEAREKDEADLRSLLPVMGEQDRARLADVIAAGWPGHRWLALLRSGEHLQPRFSEHSFLPPER